MVAHVRCEVYVAALVSNSWPSHTVRVVQTRLLVGVGTVDSYSTAKSHVASAAHCRSDVLVGHAVWYWPEMHLFISLHARSVVSVGATS